MIEMIKEAGVYRGTHLSIYLQPNVVLDSDAFDIPTYHRAKTDGMENLCVTGHVDEMGEHYIQLVPVWDIDKGGPANEKELGLYRVMENAIRDFQVDIR